MGKKESNADQQLMVFTKQMDFLVQELSDRWDGLDESLRRDYFPRNENTRS